MRKRELMGLFKFLESQGYETNSLSKFIFNLKNENEELKSQLKGTTHCYDESEHTQLKQKNEELKKELEELREQTIIDTLDLQTHKYQQQKFIKYLEDEIHTIETTYSQINGNYGLMNEKLETLKEILQKYKSIIGGKNE